MISTMDLWNDQSLKMPPVCTCSYSCEEINLGEVQRVLRILQHALSVLSDQNQWNSENFVLSRLLFKLRNSASMEKWYRGLKKVEHCIKRFHSTNLSQHLFIFEDFLARGCTGKVHQVTHLPSRQLVEFLLVKLMGTAQVLRRAAGYCMDIYTHITGQLSLGHFVHTMLLLAALVSRIRVMCKSLVLHMCQWYDSLRPLQGVFKGTEVQWLPDGCEHLPDKLLAWLEATQQQDHSDITAAPIRDTTGPSKLDNLFNSLQVQKSDFPDFNAEGPLDPLENMDTEDLGVSLDVHKGDMPADICHDFGSLLSSALLNKKTKKMKHKMMESEHPGKPSKKRKVDVQAVSACSTFANVKDKQTLDLLKPPRPETENPKVNLRIQIDAVIDATMEVTQRKGKKKRKWKKEKAESQTTQGYEKGVKENMETFKEQKTKVRKQKGKVLQTSTLQQKKKGRTQSGSTHFQLAGSVHDNHDKSIHLNDSSNMSGKSTGPYRKKKKAVKQDKVPRDRGVLQDAIKGPLNDFKVKKNKGKLRGRLKKRSKRNANKKLK